MKRISLFSLILFLQISLSVFSIEPFRFALFTDLHVSMLKPQNTEDLENAVNDLNLQKNIGFVLVSGDDTDIADFESFKVVKDILNKLKVPYYISTGNHDTNYGKTGFKNFNAVFGDDTFTFKYQNYKFIGFPTAPIVKGGTKAHISTKSLKFIKNELKKQDKKDPVFLMTHYPMLTGDVANWSDLFKILKKYNIKAILGGHYHRNVILNYDEILGIVNRSTLRGKQKLGGYSIYSISEDSLKVSEKIIGQPEKSWLTFPLNN